jgi:hypothetical protein
MLDPASGVTGGEKYAYPVEAYAKGRERKHTYGQAANEFQ